MEASRIDVVTVYREGARVERVLRVERGTREARFKGLPLPVDDGSLRASVTSPGAVALDAKVALEVPDEDTSLAPATDEALQNARRASEAARAEVTRIQHAVGRLEALKVLARPAPRENEPPLPIPIDARQRLLALRNAEEKRLTEALADATETARKADQVLSEAVDAAKRASNARNAKEHELRKTVTVALDGVNEPGEVRLSYTVPNARWSASYVLTLTGAKAKARLGMRALVAQRSGEDWRGVTLRLSTAAPDAWVELPELARARIGRVQPPPRKAGYREPPDGALSLYADYDRVAGPPLPDIADEGATDETTNPAAARNAKESPPPPPPPAPAPAGLPMMMPSSAGRAGAKSASILAAPAALLAAPMAAIARARPPKPVPAHEPPPLGGAALEELSAELDETQTRLPMAAQRWDMAAEALAYGRLRMRGPGSTSRGELIAASQASVWLEALGLRVDVVAAVHVAFQRTLIDATALPPGHELAHTDDAYDYVYACGLPCDVGSDGAFHTVPVADWDADMKVRHVAVPREAQQVYRLLEIKSPLDAALLEGPLDVYEAKEKGGEVTYRTTTRMPPTPPRGPVEIGLGVEPAIKISRTATFREESAGLLGGSLALGHDVAVEVRNLLPGAVTVEVRERVPVIRKDDSEVKVEVGPVNPPWDAWDQEQSLRGGHVWTCTVESGNKRLLSARYTIKNRLEARARWWQPEGAVTLVIDTVTVTEDRAHVRRHGKMDLSVGVTQLRIDDVSPVIADKTLRIHVENAKVGEARVVRRKVVTEPAEAHVALVREHEQRSREVEAGAANVRRLRTAIVLLDDAQRRVLTELAEDAARGMFAEGEHAVASFEAREREAYAELHVAEAAQRELERDVERLRKRLAQSGHRAERIVASIVATLSCDAPCASADVVVEYLVPGACWRPQHTATLAKDGTLTITTDACVWQNTGEDWTSALLKFSTERPSLGQKPPTLEDDELTAQRRSEVVRVEQRDVAVQHTGLGGAAPTRVPGIDDGGDVCILSGRARASVASDGRPYRVPVHEIVTKSSATLVAYPELAEAVLVRAEQANTGKAPILAGPVDLVRESGFVGRTKLALIAPGERFELGFGPDTHLRVRREFEMVTEEPGLLPTSYVGRAHRVTVHLSNLDDSARKLTVTERVPVSEMEKVEVAFDEKKTAPRSKPDDDGFVRWAVDLPPRGHVTLTMRYVLRHHKDIAGL